MNIIKNGSICAGFMDANQVSCFNNFAMLNGLMKRWKVNQTDLVVILCVFAITGTTTAFVSKLITTWVGFTDATHWSLKLILRLGVLVFGYQIILLFVAFLFGQFSFFWRYEKKILQRMGLLKKQETHVHEQLNEMV